MTESLYRKYRPQTFADVVGQDAIERTLRNALAQNKYSHAYLFTGPRGTGKTTTARLMAKALLCEKGVTPDPDGTCEACRLIADGAHPDVYELDAASRTGVENVREEIIGRVNFAPTRGRMKVYIIDEVHMLSTAAFNALLKTLEEPPDHVVFILCTTDPQKVPATIHSRCQRFDFHRISSDEIVSRLGAVCVSEGVGFEPEALSLIADRSDGGMRNALTTLEQLMAFCDGQVTLSGAEDLLGALDSSDMAEIVRAIGRRDARACFSWTAEYVETGADLAQFVEDLAARIRTLYVMAVAGEDALVELNDADRAELTEELRYFGPDRLARLLMVVGDLLSELRTARNPRLAFEIALTRMVHPTSDLTLESLAERVEELERRLAAAPVPAAATGQQPQAPAGNTPRPQPTPAARRQPQAGAQAPAAEGVHPATPAPAAATGQRPQAMPSQVGHRPEPAAPGQAPAPRKGDAAPSASPAESPAPAYREEPGASVAAPGPHPRQAEGGEQAGGRARPGAAQAQGRPMPDTSSAGQGAQTQAGAPGSAPGGAAGADLARILGNPAALQRSWKAAIDRLKEVKAAYGVLFMNTRVSPDGTGAALVVEFPATNSFAYQAASKPEVYRQLEQVVEQAFGGPLTMRLVKEGGPDAPHAAPRAGAPAAAPHPASPAAAHARQASPAAVPAPQPEPAYDEVPVDLYDEVPVDEYEADYAPIGDMAPAPPRPTRAKPAPPNPVAAAAPQPERPVFIPPTAPAAVREQAARAAGGQGGAGRPDASPEDSRDIGDILASAFGDSVTFEEVQGE